MKKKIALLLAAVMTVAMVPTSLFASSDNKLEKAPTTVPEKTMFVEYQKVAGTTSALTDIGDTGSNVISQADMTKGVDGLGNEITINGVKDVDYVVTSGILKITLKDTLASRSQVYVDLTNAVWFFRDNVHREHDYSGISFSGVDTTPNYNPKYGTWIPDNIYGNNTRGVGGTFYRGFDLSTADGRPDNSTSKAYHVDYSQLKSKNDPNYAGNVPYYLKVLEGDDRRAAVSFPAGAYAGDTICIPIVARTTTTQQVTVSITDVSNVTSITNTSLGYAIAGGGSTVTTVKDPKTDRESFPIERLLITETRFNTLGNGTIKLQLKPGFEFAGNTIEKIRNGIRKWDTSGLAGGTGTYNVNHPTILGYVEGGLTTSTGIKESVIRGASFGVSNSSYFNGNSVSNGDTDIDYSTLYINFGGLIKSSTITGQVFIEGLEIVAEDESSVWGDVTMDIINDHGLGDYSYIVDGVVGSSLINTSWRVGSITTGKTGVTAQSNVLAGKRVDWAYLFTLEKEMRTLVTGRYDNFDSSNPIDDYHYVGGKVQFQEATPGTWHTSRETTFALPGGVKIRKLDMTDFDNIWDSSVTYGIDEKNSILNSGVGNSTYYLMDENSGNYNERAYVEGTGNDYASDAKKHGFITVSNGTDDKGKEFGQFIIHPFHVKDTTKLTGFKAKLWLSIEADYVGDIILTAKGPGIRTEAWDDANSQVNLTIAKTVQPVTIETKISEVKIGYQYQVTENVVVTETAAGMLLKGKTLKLSLTDRIGNDMVFTPGYKVAVDDGSGYLKIKNLRTTSNGSAFSQNISTTGQGTIAFDISTPSTKATAITYSNLQVKVDRDVPQSNFGLDKDAQKTIGYKVYAWGSAIAENYGTKTYNKLASSGDMFSTPGVSAEYLKVITSATDKTGTLSKVVHVTIGDTKIQVGEEVFEMDTAAYISAASNSTMVPVRFISQGLGLTEQQVQWDNEARTVTIYHGDRIIQFKIGSDQLVINGVTTTIYSPDNMPVAAEIKDERSFIPMRALGNALGVTTTWDAETQTATYNSDISANAVAVDK